jgi:hypothetical protein
MMRNLVLFVSLTVSALFAEVPQNEFLEPLHLGLPETIRHSVFSTEDEILISRKNSETDTFQLDIDSEQMVRHGFRIQLVATPDLAHAEEVERRAFDIFGNEVYLVFESPNYKVRVGNFLTTRDADDFIRTARLNGFPRAWTVPSDIIIGNLNQRY